VPAEDKKKCVNVSNNQLRNDWIFEQKSFKEISIKIEWNNDY